MENWNYFNPVQVHFGEGCLDRLPFMLKGRRALVVTFPEASHTDLLHRLERLTGDLLIGLLDSAPALPDKSRLQDLCNFMHSELEAAEVIVAVGGGSVMDTGKILATLSRGTTFASLLDAIDSGETRSLSALPVIAVPTTAGTGSEVTPWATFWDKMAESKYSLHFAGLFPEVALVDPVLSQLLPPEPTLASGLDALSHSLEAIWNRNANPISDHLAVAAAKEVLFALPDLMDKPEQTQTRSRMARAALLAGLAFSNTKTALAHSISYPMTLRYSLPHGIACSFCLPLVMRRAIGKNPGRDMVLRQIFSNDLEKASDGLRDFLESLGVCTDFSGYGVGRKEAELIIEHAETGPRGRNFI